MTDLLPPAHLARVARLGIETRERVRRGGTERRLDVARKLAAGAPLDEADLRTIVEPAPYDHEGDALIAEALVGGREARRWAETMLARVVAAQRAAMPSVERRRVRLKTLSLTLARIDAELRAQLTAAAATALAEALRKAGVRVQIKAAQKRGAARVLEACADDIVAGRVTPAVRAAVGVDEDELLAHSLDSFGEQARRMVAHAQERRRRAVARATGTTVDDLDWAAREDSDRDRALALLVVGMAAVARERLAQPEIPVPDRGEVPAFPSVPPNLIGEAVRATNGAGTIHAPLPYGREMVPGRLVDDEPNPLVMEAIRAVEPMVYITQQWSHGDPARPFEPHERLDGWLSQDGGESWYDPVEGPASAITKDPAEFPEGNTMWFPGDHGLMANGESGCTCWIDPDFIPAE